MRIKMITNSPLATRDWAVTPPYITAARLKAEILELRCTEKSEKSVLGCNREST